MNRGQSIIELILAMAIFALMAATIAVFVLGGFDALRQGGEHTIARFLAQEGIEAIRSIRDGAWNSLAYTQSAVSTTAGEWTFVGEGTDETIGQYTRTITLSDVCRDRFDDIAVCPASYTDYHSKQASSVVEWEIRPGITNSVEQTTYLTNWSSKVWTQTDWSGGAGQIVWIDNTKYNLDDGNVVATSPGQVYLGQSAASSGTTDWPCCSIFSSIYNNPNL